MRRVLLLCILLIALAGSAFGTTYYVNASTGNDTTYNGTSATVGSGAVGPEATIAAAYADASDGDTISIADGTYAETLTFAKRLTVTRTASSGRPILVAAPGGAATLTLNASSGAVTIEHLDIRGVATTGNYAVVIAADTDARTFNDCLFSTGLAACVRSTGASGEITFSGCTFSGVASTATTDSAILVSNVAALTCTNCNFDGPYDSGMISINAANDQAVAITGGTWTSSSTSYLVNASTSTGAITISDVDFTPTAAGTVWLYSQGDGALTVDSGCTFSGPTPGTAYIQHDGGGALVVDANTFTTTASGLNNAIYVSTAAKTGAVTITDNTFTSSYKTDAPLICVDEGTHACTIAGNTISITATDQAQDIIYVLNQTGARILANDITLYAVSTTPKPIHCTSTGTTMARTIIAGNTIRTRQSEGHAILVGGDATGTHNQKLDGTVIEDNRIWGPLYYAHTRSVAISATGGTWTLTVGGQTTGNLAYNIAAADLKTAIDALSGEGAVTVYLASSTYYIVFDSTAVRTISTNAGGLTGGGQTATVGTVSIHGILMGYSKYGRIRNNYIYGVGYGIGVKAGAVTAATAEADDETFTTGDAHGLAVGTPIWLTSVGDATGISVNTKYYVASVPGATSFTISETRGGSAVNVTLDGSVKYDTLHWEQQGGVDHNITMNCAVNHIVLSSTMGVVVEYNTCFQNQTPATNVPMIRQKMDGSTLSYCFGAIIRGNIVYGYTGGYLFGQSEAGHTGTTITDNCWYLSGGTNLFLLDNVAATYATFAAAYPTGNINQDPRFRIKGKDFRLMSSSKCINSQSTQKASFRGEMLYKPQWSMGAIPYVYEPLKME